jgi:hypothetical protein
MTLSLELVDDCHHAGLGLVQGNFHALNAAEAAFEMGRWDVTERLVGDVLSGVTTPERPSRSLGPSAPMQRRCGHSHRWATCSRRSATGRRASHSSVRPARSPAISEIRRFCRRPRSGCRTPCARTDSWTRR